MITELLLYIGNSNIL